MSRQQAITNLRVAGFHNDKGQFVRLYVENRVSIHVANAAFREGRQMRENGQRCGCYDCQKLAQYLIDKQADRTVMP